MKNNQPLVSVPVITYNSSKFVLDTLESIKAQTYHNIELIISDDCSTDNTVELCKQWVEQNKNRFVRTQIITSEVNTGVSANLNRAEDACQGEWVKGIAGDDILMPNCIADCVKHVQQQPNIIYLFGRIEAFGASDEKNKYFSEKVFDYSFFDLDINEQLERLVFGDNCIPASTCFYNRQDSIVLGIRYDERIPLLEDWPKWINLLEKGVKLEFMDKVVVRYRVHEDSLSTSRSSAKYMESNYMFELYYRYPYWQRKNAEYGVKRMAQKNMNLYNSLLEAEKDSADARHSIAYRLGRSILYPINKIQKWLKK